MRCPKSHVVPVTERLVVSLDQLERHTPGSVPPIIAASGLCTWCDERA
jgi:hypothetical protein